MDKENKNFDIVSFLFNNESFINGLLENLKKELMEVIFSDNLSLFKKKYIYSRSFYLCKSDFKQQHINVRWGKK